MDRAELVEQVLLGKTKLTQEEAAVLGIEFPPKSGWRKKIRREWGKSAVVPNAKESGAFLIRKTGSGKAHHWINGKALCRIPKIETGRYCFADDIGSVPMCSVCAGLKDKDPRNERITDDPFYGSWEWKKARFETLKRWGARCMCCGAEHGIVVDHIKPRRFYPDLSLDLDNLQVLCDECNRGKSHDDETDFRPKIAESEWTELETMHDGLDPMH